MEIKVSVELGEKTFGILEKLFGVNQMIMASVAEPIRPIITAEDPKAMTQAVAPPVATQPAQAAAVPTQPITTATTAVPTHPTTAVPTAAVPVYTLEALAAAGRDLTTTPAKMAELQALMQSFGVNALHEIPQDKYPEVAFALRSMGANI